MANANSGNPRNMEVIPTYWCPFCKQVSVAERDDDGHIECPKCGEGKNEGDFDDEGSRIAKAIRDRNA